MSEILTESFCERCGTRYTFESARPKIRLKGVKVLSRGLKNFVLSDDTTMDEAMAAARSETDRESTAHQLDAFHKTFSFCMSCRQYTCPNCWNEVEARCQSCAPLPELQIAVPEVVPPAFPGLVSLTGPSTVDGSVPNGANGHVHDEPPAETPGTGVEPAAKAADQTAGLLSRFRPGQNLDDELAAFERAQSGLEAEPAAETLSAAEAEPTAEAVPAAEAGPTAETIPAPDTEPVAQLGTAAEPEPAVDETAIAEPEVVPESGLAVETAVETADEPEAIAAEATTEPEAPAAAQDEPASEATVAGALVAAPETVETPAGHPEPDAAPPLVAEPTPSAADVVEQPTWRITAPDLDTPSGAQARPDVAVAPAPTTPSPEPHWPPAPEWPSRPEWPTPQASAGLPFLGRPAQPQGGVESLWAASNRELVTTPPPPGRTTSGIQPCVSCGLSLSANARFCRRCGTHQAG